jgi:3-methyl-2-oxobutanoate hydroxymethyltransferase
MSLTNFPGGASSPGSPLTKVTMPALAEMKRQGKPISALTAYDYATSRLVDEAGIDLVLVGDSLAMVVLGHENTLSVTVDEMLHHTRAVRRAVRRALVVADMPFGSYHGSIADGVANAVRFVKEAGAEAVKIEGPRVELVRALTSSEIPIVGHLGLTPQSIHRMGGYRVQARVRRRTFCDCVPMRVLSPRLGLARWSLKAFRVKLLLRSLLSFRFRPSASALVPIATDRFSCFTISST